MLSNTINKNRPAAFPIKEINKISFLGNLSMNKKARHDPKLIPKYKTDPMAPIYLSS